MEGEELKGLKKKEKREASKMLRKKKTKQHEIRRERKWLKVKAKYRLYVVYG